MPGTMSFKRLLEEANSAGEQYKHFAAVKAQAMQELGTGKEGHYVSAQIVGSLKEVLDESKTMCDLASKIGLNPENYTFLDLISLSVTFTKYLTLSQTLTDMYRSMCPVKVMADSTLAMLLEHLETLRTVDTALRTLLISKAGVNPDDKLPKTGEHYVRNS